MAAGSSARSGRVRPAGNWIPGCNALMRTVFICGIALPSDATIFRWTCSLTVSRCEAEGPRGSVPKNKSKFRAARLLTSSAALLSFALVAPVVTDGRLDGFAIYPTFIWTIRLLTAISLLPGVMLPACTLAVIKTMESQSLLAAAAYQMSLKLASVPVAKV